MVFKEYPKKQLQMGKNLFAAAFCFEKKYHCCSETTLISPATAVDHGNIWY